MARARNLKPGFFKNEDLAECSPWARLCFAGLWTLADREGRLEDRPKRIKGELFAFDSIEVEPLLAELERFGFLLRYQAEGRGFIQVLKFLQHQNPHHKEPPSAIPSPQSLGLLPHGTDAKPEIPPASHDDETQDKPKTFGPIPALSSTPNRAESLFSESGEEITPAALSAGPPTKPPGKPATPPCPYGDIVDAYHEALPTLPRVKLRDGPTWEDRKRTMRKFWDWVATSRKSDGTPRGGSQEQAMAWIRSYFGHAARNDFVMGRTRRSAEHEHWRADLDYLLSKSGVKQVIEKTEAVAA
jgi:hypothetical protein